MKNQTRNVLAMGDLNVNPFEETCIAANTIHAIPYVEELSKHPLYWPYKIVFFEYNFRGNYEKTSAFTNEAV